jgi:hypothetical protein
MTARPPRRGAALAFALATTSLAARAGARASAEEPPEPPPAPPAAPAEPAAPAKPADPAAAGAEARLRADVLALASPALRGRGSAEDRARAARIVEAGLRAAGLSPLPGKTSMRLPFEWRSAKSGDAPAHRGENVAAWLPGAGPDHVIVSAHYDHLGVKDGKVHPGADDNASGVAAMLECARTLAKGPRPRRSIAFVAFDLEEGDATRPVPVGSTAWVESAPVPIERLSAFVTADMLGRSLGDAYPGLLLVMGSERAEAFGEVLSALPVPQGHALHRLGMDFNALGWSDYLPFEEARIPSLFFTSGACRDYHRPEDVPEALDYAALAVRTDLLTRTVRALADLPEAPAWVERPEPSVEEARSVLTLVSHAAAQAEAMGVPDAQRAMLGFFQKMVEGVVATGKVTEGQRFAIRTGALRLFAAATEMRPGR